MYVFRGPPCTSGPTVPPRRWKRKSEVASRLAELKIKPYFTYSVTQNSSSTLFKCCKGNHRGPSEYSCLKFGTGCRGSDSIKTEKCPNTPKDIIIYLQLFSRNNCLSLCLVFAAEILKYALHFNGWLEWLILFFARIVPLGIVLFNAIQGVPCLLPIYSNENCSRISKNSFYRQGQ